MTEHEAEAYIAGLSAKQKQQLNELLRSLEAQRRKGESA